MNFNEAHHIGLLVPSSDTVMEPDLWGSIPENIHIHVARMYMASTTIAGEQKMLDDELEPAAHRIGSVEPELVIFGCTSAAALRGLEGDADIAKRVESIAGCKCITVVQAVFADLNRIKPERLLLITPYLEDVTERLRRTFVEAGQPVIETACMGLDSDLEIAHVHPEEITQFISQAVERSKPAPDCVFVSCTTFRAFEIAEKLENEHGLPVVTSNRSAYRVIRQYFNKESGASF
jgi:maleate isomerase